MKRILLLTFLTSCALSCFAASTDEAGLIATLKSGTAGVREKNAACVQLKRTGTPACIDAVAALLTDDHLSDSARYVLETMPSPAAGKALLQALPKTSGRVEAGIINSLGMRRETGAVPSLSKLLASTEKEIAIASANSLGHIGNSKAVGFLLQDSAKSAGELHRDEIDGLLASANRLLNHGKQKDALKLFQTIYKQEKSGNFRIAAYRGVILASGKDKVARMFDGLVKNDSASRAAALQVASRFKSPDATRALMLALLQTPVPVQLALIQCLAYRDDPAAAPAIVKIADSPDADVRAASLTALGKLGDESCVSLLSTRAASGTGNEKAFARQSLLELHRGPVAEKMIALLSSVPPENKTELMRALGGRQDHVAVPALLDLARNSDGAVHASTCQTLGLLAGNPEMSGLVQLVVSSKSDAARSEATDALNATIQRIESAGGPLDITAFTGAFTHGSEESRIALLPLCSDLKQEPVRAALLSAITDPNAQVRDAALHALYDTKDVHLLPELKKLACDTTHPELRLPAIRGCVRMTTQEDTARIPDNEKLDAFAEILAAPPLGTQEKRLLLSGLQAVSAEKSLELATTLLDDSAVKTEAEQAVVQIASKLVTSNPAKAGTALKQVASATQNAATRKSAEDSLKKIK